MNSWIKVLYVVFLFFYFGTLWASAEELDDKVKITKAYDAYQKAFEHYTSLAFLAQKGDREEALEAYRNKYAEYKQLTETQGKVSSVDKPKVQKPLDTTGIDGIVDIDPSDVEDNIAYIEGLRERTEDQTQKTESTLPEPNQQTDRCKSKEFKDLQLSATNYLEEEKIEMALEQFEKAYSICPTKES